MKIVKLKCQNCGAALEINEKIAYCAYCGEKLLIDHEAQKRNRS